MEIEPATSGEAAVAAEDMTSPHVTIAQMSTIRLIAIERAMPCEVAAATNDT
jgi:hypothetical protein